MEKIIKKIREDYNLQNASISELNRFCCLHGYRLGLWSWNKVYGVKDYNKRNQIILFKEIKWK